MALIGLLIKFFWKNLKKRKFPNQVIHVNKLDMLEIEAVHFENPISGVNLNGSLSYLSNLERISKKEF